MTADDPFDLHRFLQAQGPFLDAITDELGGGRKRTHWMWFVFPQLKALGRSPTAQHYGVDSLDEAQAYLAHPTLGPRLRDMTDLVLRHTNRSAHAIFGSPDDLKFRSSMTLFDAVDGSDDQPFRTALRAFYNDEPDRRTLELIGRS